MSQERYFDVLTQRVREDRYPSLDLLNRIEASLAGSQQLSDYVNLLIDKMHETRYPSKNIMDRIERLAPHVAATPPPADSGIDGGFDGPPQETSFEVHNEQQAEG